MRARMKKKASEQDARLIFIADIGTGVRGTAVFKFISYQTEKGKEKKKLLLSVGRVPWNCIAVLYAFKMKAHLSVCLE